MKNFLTTCFILLLCVILVGGIYVSTKSDISKNITDVESSVSNGEDSVENSSGVPEEDSASNESAKPSEGTGQEDSVLKDPSNLSALVVEGMQMRKGAQLYIGSDEERPKLRYSCDVSNTLKAEIDGDENKQFAILVYPRSRLDAINPNNYTYIDWVTELDKAGKTDYILSLYDGNYNEDKNGYYLGLQMEKIPYSTINVSMSAIGVVITTHADGTKSYQYSSFPAGQDYRSNARSVAYVAAASLNAYELGMEDFSSEEVAELKGYINESVDKANKLTEPTNDGSMYAFTTNVGATKSLTVGESFMITTTISPDVDVPVWYRSSDEAILTVDDGGKVTAKAKGTAVIGVYVAGETFGITVTVS